MEECSFVVNCSETAGQHSFEKEIYIIREVHDSDVPKFVILQVRISKYCFEVDNVLPVTDSHELY